MSNLIPVAIDPGHGKDTWNKLTQTGSKGIGDFAEFDFNSPVAGSVKLLAERNGFKVILTQPLDGDDVSLSARTNLARQQGAKAFISIHADAHSDPAVKGHHGFYWHTDPEAKRLATIWARYATEYLKNPARGDHGTVASVPDTWTEFHMCREPNKVGIPAILIEHAFFTNPGELQLLKTAAFRQACAVAIVRSLCEFFNVPYKEEGPAPKLPWQQQQGLDAVAYLHSIGQISNPETWTAARMDEPAPTWLVMSLIARANGMK